MNIISAIKSGQRFNRKKYLDDGSEYFEAAEKIDDSSPLFYLEDILADDWVLEDWAINKNEITEAFVAGFRSSHCSFNGEMTDEEDIELIVKPNACKWASKG